MKYFLILLLTVSPIFGIAQDENKVPIVEILYSTMQKQGAKKTVSKYYELKRSDRDLYDFSFGQLNRLGLRLQSEKRINEAIEIFRLNLKEFPEKVTAHNLLADALLKANKKDIARNYYLKGLEKLKAIPNMDPSIYKSYEDYGKRKIQIIDELNTSESPDLTYWAYVGGIPASNWDVDQIIRFKQQSGTGSVGYKTQNLYNAPVPNFINEEFNTKGPNLVSGFVKGVYRDHMDSLSDLSGLWDAKSLDSSFPAFIKEAVSYDNKPYFIPLSFQWNPIWYRKDVFDSLGLEVPETWDEFLTLSKKLDAAGKIPVTVSGQGWQPPLARWFSILTLRLHGHEFYEEFMSGSIPWTDDRIIKVFEYWKTLFDQKVLHPASASNNWSDAVADLASGRAAMWNIGEWMFEFKPLQEQMDNIGVFPLPPIDTAIEQTEILHLYGMHKIISAPAAADDFLSYMASKEVQSTNHEILSYRIPANHQSHEKLSELQKAELNYLSEVRHFVPLFEFNTHPEIAQAALDEFLYFWKNPDKAGEVVERMEILRKDIYSND